MGTNTILKSIQLILLSQSTTLTICRLSASWAKCSTVHSKHSSSMLDSSQRMKIFIVRVGKLRMPDQDSTLAIFLMIILTQSPSTLFKSQMLMATMSNLSISNIQLMGLLTPVFLTHSTVHKLART